MVNGKIRSVEYNKRLREFKRKGVDIFRINMAFYGNRDLGRISNGIIPALKRITDKPIAIMGNLGPKIRIAGPPHEIKLVRGDTLTFHFEKLTTDSQNKEFTVILYDKPFSALSQYIAQAFNTSDEIIIAIGEADVVLSAKKKDFKDTSLSCTVIRSGKFKGKKGITFRKVNVKFARYLTPKVQTQIDFLLAHAKDLLAFLALSFVQNARDILAVRNYLEKWFISNRRKELKGLKYCSVLGLTKSASLCMPMIIAKIETEEAIKNIDEIILAADGIMIARGDLGLQIGIEKVPAVQKEIIKKCNLLGKPVITATQMLRSMTEHPSPTRAEASDVFNAILDGSDAIMLSDETSDGPYPFQAIETAATIATEAEKHYCKIEKSQDRYQRILGESLLLADEIIKTAKKLEHNAKKEHKRYWSEQLKLIEMQGITDRVTESACTLSNYSDVKAIITLTTSGRTTRMISRFRPKSVPIVGATHDKYNYRKLILSYGVKPINIKTDFSNSSTVTDEAVNQARRMSFIRKRERVVVTSGWPLFTPGTTNIVKIYKV